MDRPTYTSGGKQSTDFSVDAAENKQCILGRCLPIRTLCKSDIHSSCEFCRQNKCSFDNKCNECAKWSEADFAILQTSQIIEKNKTNFIQSKPSEHRPIHNISPGSSQYSAPISEPKIAMGIKQTLNPGLPIDEDDPLSAQFEGFLPSDIITNRISHIGPVKREISQVSTSEVTIPKRSKTTLGVRFSDKSSSDSVVSLAHTPSGLLDSDQNTYVQVLDRVPDPGALEASPSPLQIRLEVEEQVPCGSHNPKYMLEHFPDEPLKIQSDDQGSFMSETVWEPDMSDHCEELDFENQSQNPNQTDSFYAYNYERIKLKTQEAEIKLTLQSNKIKTLDLQNRKLKEDNEYLISNFSNKEHSDLRNQNVLLKQELDLAHSVVQKSMVTILCINNPQNQCKIDAPHQQCLFKLPAIPL